MPPDNLGSTRRDPSAGAAFAPDASAGAFARNVLHFIRLVRRVGLPVSTAQAADLTTAFSLIDLGRRNDVYHAAAGFLVHSPHERALFDMAFNLFWSEGDAWLAVTRTSSGARLSHAEDEPRAAEGRSVEEQSPAEQPDAAGPEETAVEATYSPIELLHEKDFSAYNSDELALAQRSIDALVWQLSKHATRRREAAPKRAGYLDLSRTIRGSLPYDGEIIDLAWQRRKAKPRPLTVICDISGSMDRYSRIFLHFIYALASAPNHQRVEAFVFGTRLTRITPALRQRNIEVALADVAATTRDWAGGTRIGEALREHNFRWARRTLGRGAVAIIISDGWDRGDIELLRQEMSRLRRSAYRLIWLNPLLGAPDYQPLALGIQAALPFVDDFLPLHNLASLEALALQLGQQILRE